MGLFLLVASDMPVAAGDDSTVILPSVRKCATCDLINLNLTDLTDLT